MMHNNTTQQVLLSFGKRKPGEKFHVYRDLQKLKYGPDINEALGVVLCSLLLFMSVI